MEKSEVVNLISEKGWVYALHYHCDAVLKYYPDSVVKFYPSIMCSLMPEYMIEYWPKLMLIHKPEYMFAHHPDVVKKIARPFWDRVQLNGGNIYG